MSAQEARALTSCPKCGDILVRSQSGPWEFLIACIRHNCFGGRWPGKLNEDSSKRPSVKERKLSVLQERINQMKENE